MVEPGCRIACVTRLKGLFVVASSDKRENAAVGRVDRCKSRLNVG